MTSTAEAEVASLFMNAQEAVPTRTCLIEMGHPQLATKMKTDNMTAKGIPEQVPSNRRDPKQLTCNSTGSETK